MDINVNITGVGDNDNGKNSSLSFDPRIILDPEFESSVEITMDKINSMIDEIDKYYNIRRDPKLRTLIREVIESRALFLNKYHEFKSWYNKNK